MHIHQVSKKSVEVQLPALVKTFDDTRNFQEVVTDSLDDGVDMDFEDLRGKLGPQGQVTNLKKDEVVNIAAALQYYANIILSAKDVSLTKLFSPPDEPDDAEGAGPDVAVPEAGGTVV